MKLCISLFSMCLTCFMLAPNPTACCTTRIGRVVFIKRAGDGQYCLRLKDGTELLIVETLFNNFSLLTFRDGIQTKASQTPPL